MSGITLAYSSQPRFHFLSKYAIGREITEADISKIRTAPDIDHVAGWWDKITDMFCCTHKVQAKIALYKILKSKNQIEILDSFFELRSLAEGEHKKRINFERNQEEIIFFVDGNRPGDGQQKSADCSMESDQAHKWRLGSTRITGSDFLDQYISPDSADTAISSLLILLDRDQQGSTKDNACLQLISTLNLDSCTTICIPTRAGEGWKLCIPCKPGQDIEVKLSPDLLARNVLAKLLSNYFRKYIDTRSYTACEDDCKSNLNRSFVKICLNEGGQPMSFAPGSLAYDTVKQFFKRGDTLTLFGGQQPGVCINSFVSGCLDRRFLLRGHGVDELAFYKKDGNWIVSLGVTRQLLVGPGVDNLSNCDKSLLENYTENGSTVFGETGFEVTFVIDATNGEFECQQFKAHIANEIARTKDGTYTMSDQRIDICK